MQTRTLLRYCVFSLAVMLVGGSAVADGTAKNPRMSVTLSVNESSSNEPAVLTVVLLGDAAPSAAIADTVLRGCLTAASAIGGGSDILGQVWHATSDADADRSLVVLADSATGILWRASDKSMTPVTESSSGASPGSSQTDDPAAIVAVSDVAEACKDVAPDLLLKMAEHAINSRGDRRTQIVREVRNWCKEHEMQVTRDLNFCIVAISHAAHVEKVSPESIELTGDELAETISRGADAYDAGGCQKCHGRNGTGGGKGPNLTDSTWVHCNGSIDGIRAVLMSGVPSDKLSDKKYPWGMNPVIERLNEEQIADLAVYVKSLSEQ